jgi:alpha-L-arabinofuranosidase
LNNPTFRARTKASGLRLLRLPGGSWSNTYGWLSCELGADQPGAQPCDENWETWAAKPSDFIAFLKATEVEGLWVVNPNSTAKEAAALVAFFNGHVTDTRSIGVDIRGTNWYTVGHWAALRAGKGYTDPVPIRFWEFGNEVYASRADYASPSSQALCQGGGAAWENKCERCPIRDAHLPLRASSHHPLGGLHSTLQSDLARWVI